MKNRITRRDLFALTGASLISPALLAHPQEDPSTVAPTWSSLTPRLSPSTHSNLAQRRFAIKNGRFLAVGSNPDVRNLIRRGTPIWDAKGAAIVPGFIDTHNHGRGAILLYEVLVGNPFEVEFVTIDSIIQKLRARAAQTPAGTWVEGYFLRRHQSEGMDGRLQSTISTRFRRTTPLRFTTAAGTLLFTTRKPFELADVNSQTPNPAGGTFDRDLQGR